MKLKDSWIRTALYQNFDRRWNRKDRKWSRVGHWKQHLNVGRPRTKSRNQTNSTGRVYGPWTRAPKMTPVSSGPWARLVDTGVKKMIPVSTDGDIHGPWTRVVCTELKSQQACWPLSHTTIEICRLAMGVNGPLTQISMFCVVAFKVRI